MEDFESEMASEYRRTKPTMKHLQISAETLRAIVLLTIQRLEDPKTYDHNNLSTTASGRCIGVWEPGATVFSELGHIWRAAEKAFLAKEGFLGPLRFRDSRVTRTSDLIDAQIRLITEDESGEERTLVSLAVENGRTALIQMLGKVAKRLEEGDSMIIEPIVHAALPLTDEEIRERRILGHNPERGVLASIRRR